MMAWAVAPVFALLWMNAIFINEYSASYATNPDKLCQDLKAAGFNSSVNMLPASGWTNGGSSNQYRAIYGIYAAQDITPHDLYIKYIVTGAEAAGGTEGVLSTPSGSIYQVNDKIIAL